MIAVGLMLPAQASPEVSVIAAGRCRAHLGRRLRRAGVRARNVMIALAATRISFCINYEWAAVGLVFWAATVVYSESRCRRGERGVYSATATA